MISRIFCCLLLVLAVCASAMPSRAQLATNFYNITKIETVALPNALQITIRCDGAPVFGSELQDWIDFSSGFSPKPTARLRLRFLRAKSLLPAFNDVSVYPADAIVVSPGRDNFANPYFEGDDGSDDANTRVDLELRFAVPILVRRVSPSGGYGIRFGDYLGPRELSVARGSDNTSVVITIFTDRADARAATAIKRAPVEGQKHRLSVRLLDKSSAQFRFDALHSTLGESLQAVSDTLGVALLASPESVGDDVSLLLPKTSVPEFLNALQNGSGYAVVPLASGNGEGFLVGRNGALFQTERLPLRHLRPDAARLLFPDFLLPFLRADPETNALIISAPSAIVARVRRDLQTLDAPRAQVKITAQIYEVSEREVRLANLTFGNVGGTTGLSGDLGGSFGVILSRGQAQRFTGQLQLLQERGVARLRAQPNVTVLVGETGNLFLGQNRFVQVLRNNYDGQSAEVEQLEIGLSLRARALASAPEGITIEISPRISTVDAIEAGTRLPTLGVREAQSTVRLRAGESALVAGLDSQLNERARRALGLSGERSREKTTLLLLVSATRA